MLSEHLARHRPLFDGLAIRYSIEAEDITGFFDRELMTGVLNNIINNAIRYTDRQIRIIARTSDGFLVIAVEDDGKGYPEVMLTEGEASFGAVNFERGSTRLGLYFASAIARLHQQDERQGGIRLSNGGSLGRGVFEIWLP
ncbi:ATP-binding protein [Marinobacter salinisoli]|uniref:histidine kinase n=1 Tax=Marinobacter salinisoli TaxID=2769486 RepID=A0ABX7MPQ6_9GAMM|nr:ATP-binding protein [Marinobacter salinisoli]QSP94273.1 ATP-binding protein [Marinobacter salinisoli]